MGSDPFNYLHFVKRDILCAPCPSKKMAGRQEKNTSCWMLDNNAWRLREIAYGIESPAKLIRKI